MHGLNGPVRILIAVLLLVGMTWVAPTSASAACGGAGFDDPGAYARRAGRIADTILMGRLVEVDAERNYHFELVEVYRGAAPASPIVTDTSTSVAGIVEVGRCNTGQSVEPGGLFIYASGPQAERFGPMQLVFSRIPGQGWLINHCCDYATLDHLLDLLGVLPATSMRDTAAGVEEDQSGLRSFLPAVLGLTWLAYWGLGKRRPAK